MKLPRDLSGTEVARRLARHYGYRVTRSRGSHMTVTLTAGGDEHQVTVPRHRDVRIGTLDAIIADVAAFLGCPRKQYATPSSVDAMAAELKPYPAYKDSGVEWLGTVPAHWEVGPVKRQYALRLGKMLRPARRGGDDCQVAYLKAKHVQWFEVRTTDIDMMWAAPNEVERYGVVAGDLLVCEGGDGGRCGMVYRSSLPDPCIIQNALHRVRPRLSGSVGHGSRNDYLQYLMSMVASTGWFDVLTDKATIAHFTAEKFGALLMPIPPSPEQAAVVRFLARATDNMRAAVTSSRRQIERVREYRACLIADVVTGKLDVREAAARLPETDPLVGDDEPNSDDHAAGVLRVEAAVVGTRAEGGSLVRDDGGGAVGREAQA